MVCVPVFFSLPFVFFNCHNRVSLIPFSFFFAYLAFPCLWDLKRKGESDGRGGVHDDRIEIYMIR